MDDLIKVIPEKWRGTALILLAISPYITRGIKGCMAGGGIKGFLSAIWLGTNTPKPNNPEKPDSSKHDEK